MIRITNFARGARGVRVGWVCEEMGLAYEVVKMGYPPGADYLERNCVGTVPLLEDGEVRIAESVAMMLYLAGKYGPTPLLPGAGEEGFAGVMEMVVLAEASLGACINVMLAGKFAAPAGESGNWLVARHAARGEQLVEYVSRRLGENDYLAAGRLTLADIAVETALRMWVGVLGMGVAGNVAAYRERLVGIDSYRRAVLAQG